MASEITGGNKSSGIDIQNQDSLPDCFAELSDRLMEIENRFVALEKEGKAPNLIAASLIVKLSGKCEWSKKDGYLFLGIARSTRTANFGSI